MKKIEDRFNFRDLPRDGKTLFLNDSVESMEAFRLMAPDAAYILVPDTQWGLVAKWAAQFHGFQFAEMTPENTAGGYMATYLGTDIFSDIYSADKYPVGAPVLFGQFTGSYVRELELSRCPYLGMKEKRAYTWSPATLTYDGLMAGMMPYLTLVKAISIPCEYITGFIADLDAKLASGEVERRMFTFEAVPERSMNGYVGTLNTVNGKVEIYTDSRLHPALCKSDEPIAFHREIWIAPKH